MRQQGGRADAAGEAFWRFSLALYARSGVAEALLALQDRAGRNVNLTLFALWLGATRGERLDAAALAAAEAAIAALDAAIVAPLRGLRRRLTSVPDRDGQELRRRIAGLELTAERRVQHRLAASLPGEARPGLANDRLANDRPEEDRLATAAANLALYLGDEDGTAEAALLRRSLAALMRRA